METNKQTIFNAIVKEIDELSRISVDLELINDDIKEPHIRRAFMDRIAAVKDKAETLSVYATLYPRSE